MKREGKRFSAGGLTFVLAVFAEVLAFIGVGQLIGFGWTVLLLIAVSLVGVVLVRRESLRAWQRWRAVAASGERPGPQLTRALVGLVGAVLVAVPGFVSAVVGLAMFVPPVRGLAGRGAAVFATRRLAPGVVGDVFGPRRVRVRVGKPTTTPPDPAAPGGAPRPGESGDTPIEGEIV